MHKNLVRLETNHQKSLKNIEKFLTNHDPEIMVLCNYLLETDANPYSFLPEKWASSLETSSGVESLFYMISHALQDDGEISFPIVNKEPRICFAYPDCDNYEYYVLTNQERDIRERLGTEYVIEQCSGVIDFVTRHKEYHRKDILRCFIQDASMHGLEFAVNHYSQYHNFDPDWEFDTDVLNQIKKKAMKMNYLSGVL